MAAVDSKAKGNVFKKLVLSYQRYSMYYHIRWRKLENPHNWEADGYLAFQKFDYLINWVMVPPQRENN